MKILYNDCCTGINAQMNLAAMLDLGIDENSQSAMGTSAIKQKKQHLQGLNAHG